MRRSLVEMVGIVILSSVVGFSFNALAPEAKKVPLTGGKQGRMENQGIRTVTLEEVRFYLDNEKGTIIVDARSPEEYGLGHIPGALNRPFGDNIGADGRFKPADVLRTEFEALLAGRNASTVVHQCGSGVSALPNMLAMEVAGLGKTTLFAGSWSEWCSDPSRPVERG